MNKVIDEKLNYKVLLILCISSFISPFMGSSFNLALPKIAEHFSLNAVLLTWFNTGFLISTAIFQIPFARVADMLGRKRMFKISMLGLAMSTLITPFAPNSTVLMALRCLSGMFSAMMFGTNMAILMTEVPLKSRAAALALNTVFVYSALAVGPFIGGVLTQYAGWQSIFYTSGGMILLMWLGSAIILKNEKMESKAGSFDLVGSIIYAAGLIGIIYGFTALPHIQGVVFIIIGLAAMAVFAVYETKVAVPVLDVSIFKTNKIFTVSCTAALINYAANSATAFILSLYLQYIKGFNADKAGLVLIAQAVVQVAASITAGKLSSRHAPAKLALMGMSISAVGLASFAFLAPDTHIAIITLNLMVLGFGFGLFASPNTNVIMSSVEKRHYGQASATTGTVRLTGQAFSIGLAAMAISIYMGKEKMVPELMPQFMKSVSLTFVVFTGLSLLGVYMAYLAYKKVKDAAGA